MARTLSSTSVRAVAYPRAAERRATLTQLPRSGSRFALLIAGTGGAFPEDNLAQILRWTYTLAFALKTSSSAKTIDARSTQSHLLNLRNMFDLKMSEIADMFGVSRPTAYAWSEGAEPKLEMARKIIAASQAADRLTIVDRVALKRLVRTPMFEGKSLLHLIRDGQFTGDAANAIERAALATAEEHARSERHSRQRKRNRDNIDAFAPPVLTERD